MTRILRRSVLSSLVLALSLAAAPALGGEAGEPLRIGVLNDHFGTYADFSGLGSVEAARMAAEEVGGTVIGRPVEILAGDHENKPDKGKAVVADWFDRQNVGAVADMTNSGVALAVQDLARARNRVALYSGPATPALTGKACSPVGIHWAFDTYSQAVGTARALVQDGKDTWFILSVDDPFGKAMQADIVKAVEGVGGKIVGSAIHPLNAEDLSRELIQAQASGAKVIALANGGNDTVNAIKQAGLLGIDGTRQTVVGLVVVLGDIHNIGLEDARGLSFLSAFDADRDEASRAWARRYFGRTGRMPGMVQAGVYSAVLHYLKAVERAGTDNADAVIKAMKSMPVDDAFAKGGRIRDDGRMVHDMYLMRVKTREESQGAWDYVKVVRVLPADQAFRPLAESECPLVRH